MDRITKALQAASTLLWLTMLSGAEPSLAQTGPDAATKQAARTLASSICSRCHGVDGRSTDPTVPNIAGQQQSYTEVQLRAFRAQDRRDPEAHDYMWGISSAWLLNDQILTAIASYYASQPPAPGIRGDPAVVAMGKELYDKGSPDRGIPACAGCHGANAEGLSVFPRLAGQHAQYLTRQMQMLRVRLRDSPVMHGIARDLNDNEIAAVAAYLQSK